MGFMRKFVIVMLVLWVVSGSCLFSEGARRRFPRGLPRPPPRARGKIGRGGLAPRVLASLSKGSKPGTVVVSIVNKHSNPVAVFTPGSVLAKFQRGNLFNVLYKRKRFGGYRRGFFVAKGGNNLLLMEKRYVLLRPGKVFKKLLTVKNDYATKKNGMPTCNDEFNFRASLRPVFFFDYRICNKGVQNLDKCVSQEKKSKLEGQGKNYKRVPLPCKTVRRFVQGKVKPCPRKEVAKSKSGKPVLLSGNNGRVKTGGSTDDKAKSFLDNPKTKGKMHVKTSGKEELATSQRSSGDEKNKKEAHSFIETKLDGKKVYGGDLAVHMDKKTNRVYHVSGRRLTMADVLKSREGTKPKMTAAQSIPIAMETIRKRYAKKTIQRDTKKATELCYVFDDDDIGRLAYRFVVKYFSRKTGIPQVADIFSSAKNGRFLVEDPHNQAIMNRRWYNARNSQYNRYTGWTTTRILSITEGGRLSGDSDMNNGYSNTKKVYDYFKNRFGRDSYNARGAIIHSTSHVGVRYNNAFWNGLGLFYGDGDGSRFNNMESDITIVGHEFAHAVVSKTARLVYSGESGALNEGTADIFGYSIHRSIGGANNWLIGAAATPRSTALRYMYSPTKDGASKDYYPERYTGTGDNGGVHYNSGIANLFYKLVTDGGKHPRGKLSWLTVKGIGMRSSEKIWYRALTVYFTSRTSFAEARAHTIRASSDYYGASSSQTKSVKDAWGAVGVGSPHQVKPPPPKPTCFPAESTVEDAKGKQIKMKNLKVGQIIQTFDFYKNKIQQEPVIAFIHYAPEESSPYTQIKTQKRGLEGLDEQVLSISDTHLMFKKIHGKWKAVRTFSLKVGDIVLRGKQEVEIIEIDKVALMEGIFAPLTSSGTLIVDGIATSCYGEIQSQTIAHFSFAPYRAYLKLVSLFPKIFGNANTMPAHGEHILGYVTGTLYNIPFTSLLY